MRPHTLSRVRCPSSSLLALRFFVGDAEREPDDDLRSDALDADRDARSDGDASGDDSDRARFFPLRRTLGLRLGQGSIQKQVG